MGEALPPLTESVADGGRGHYHNACGRRLAKRHVAASSDWNPADAGDFLSGIGLLSGRSLLTAEDALYMYDNDPRRFIRASTCGQDAGAPPEKHNTLSQPITRSSAPTNDRCSTRKNACSCKLHGGREFAKHGVTLPARQYG